MREEEAERRGIAEDINRLKKLRCLGHLVKKEDEEMEGDKETGRIDRIT